MLNPRQTITLPFCMKTFLLTAAFLGAVTLAKADFTSYSLVSQSDPLTYAPTVSYTYDSLSIDMLGNSPNGMENFATNQNTSATTNATVKLSFTDSASIVGDKVEVIWLYPTASSVFETFSAVPVPGTIYAGFGAGDFTISGDTVTIVNTTSGWSAGSYNGFEILDLTRQAAGPAGPNGTVPDTGSTLALVGAALAGLVLVGCRRGFGARRLG